MCKKADSESADGIEYCLKKQGGNENGMHQQLYRVFLGRAGFKEECFQNHDKLNAGAPGLNIQAQNIFS